MKSTSKNSKLMGADMNRVYIISTCAEVYKNSAIFTFKGFYKGQEVTRIRVLPEGWTAKSYKSFDKGIKAFTKGTEYMLKLNNISVGSGILNGTLLLRKELFDEK